MPFTQPSIDDVLQAITWAAENSDATREQE